MNICSWVDFKIDDTNLNLILNLHLVNCTVCKFILYNEIFVLFSIAAGNSKGFAVANFLVKQVVLIHPTVAMDGAGSRSITR